MTTYHLGSSGLVHTPGILAWAQNGYAFKKDQPNLLKIFTEGWPTIPPEAFDALLRQEVTHRIEDDVVIFDAYVKTSPTPETEAEYWEALECMPPVNFGRRGGVEFFMISELLTDNIACWHAHYGEKYFTFNDDYRLPMADLVAKIKEVANNG